jgi:HAD superfamily hydrolase (TIGR01509 family)
MKGVIFDQDGTMIDNMMVHHRAWQKKLADIGLDMTLEEVRREIHGINEEILERIFGDRFTQEERKQIAWEKEATYREIFLPELKLIDGLQDLIERLYKDGIPMGIGTAAPPENVDFVMDNLELRKYFKAILHAKDVEKGKPDPEIYLKVAAGLELDPQDCVVVDDTPTGALSADRAGCKVIVITTTHTPDEFDGIHVERFIENFRGLEL